MTPAPLDSNTDTRVEPLERRRPRHERIRGLLTTEPPWIIRDGAIALVIGIMLLGGQWAIDDRRSGREQEAAELLNDQAAARSNLQFVRERSSSEKANRPFTAIDLHEQNLSGLLLQGSDFTSADLSGANLTGTNLEGSIMKNVNLTGATLIRTNLARTDLSCPDPEHSECSLLASSTLMLVDLQGANLAHANLTATSVLGGDLRSANLQDASLDGATLESMPGPLDLRGADFTGATFNGLEVDENVCWDERTRWPVGFTPPRSPDC